ncbi:MAG: hypothetical protein GY928_14830 [Colwellia sp.]|nr:hypothetical protein [Colwellia sp.]
MTGHRQNSNIPEYKRIVNAFAKDFGFECVEKDNYITVKSDSVEAEIMIKQFKYYNKTTGKKDNFFNLQGMLNNQFDCVGVSC